MTDKSAHFTGIISGTHPIAGMGTRTTGLRLVGEGRELGVNVLLTCDPVTGEDKIQVHITRKGQGFHRVLEFSETEINDAGDAVSLSDFLGFQTPGQ